MIVSIFLDCSNFFFSPISCCIIVKELITHTHSLHKLSMSHPFIFFIMEKLCLALARFFVMQENFSFLVKCIYEWPQDPLYCNLILQQLSRLIPTHTTMHVVSYVNIYRSQRCPIVTEHWTSKNTILIWNIHRHSTLITYFAWP